MAGPLGVMALPVGGWGTKEEERSVPAEGSRAVSGGGGAALPPPPAQEDEEDGCAAEGGGPIVAAAPPTRADVVTTAAAPSVADGTGGTAGPKALPGSP